MRQFHLAIAMLFLTPLPLFAQAADKFDPAEFAQRFRAADKNKDGKLTRDEAYAAFPRIPQYFDEIDSNHDNAITLAEVTKAREKRVNAALAASKAGGGRYALPAGATTASTDPAFGSRSEAIRYHRHVYYESLAGERERDRMQGEPVPYNQAPGQIQKSF